MLEEKQHWLREAITDRKIRYTWHDARVSRIEAVFARGDRRLSAALLEAHRRGRRFDAWDEFFDYDEWLDIFASVGIDPAFYANRKFSRDEILPWDVIDCGVKKSFFAREADKAYESQTTRNCAEACSGCGANSLPGEHRWCPMTGKACTEEK